MRTLGIIGFGNMGSCIAERIKAKSFEIWVFDKDKNKTQNLLEINVAGNAIDLVNKVDNIILAVKPQDFGVVLNEIKNNVKDKLIISIAAGITTAFIEKYLDKVRIIRAMPNMPARIGEGMTCLCKGRYANEEDLDFSKKLFDNLGKTLMLSDEEMMDVATAISGSGPGYFFRLVGDKKLDINNQNDVEIFIDGLEKEAIEYGFETQEAITLVETTTAGCIKLIKISNFPPKELEKQIVSKGGTTEAALNVLYNKSPYSLHDAVDAALKRARELSKK